jgi:endonuclease YncB( thermonuclease family)
MRRNTSWSAALAAALLLVGCATDSGGDTQAAGARAAKTISGPALARDGDTVEVDGRLFDLWGIDAPNLDNADGWYARAALDDLIGRNGTLACTIKDTTKRRDEAACSNSRAGDVGLAMLQGGWAVVSRSDTAGGGADGALAAAYADAETAARRKRAGFWASMPRR